ncbi:MAG: hypothetical protein ACYCZW_02495 [Minisyncoccota bacterium]
MIRQLIKADIIDILYNDGSSINVAKIIYYPTGIKDSDSSVGAIMEELERGRLIKVVPNISPMHWVLKKPPT